MRPILLSGHERALQQVKYNAEGDLIFSCSKDSIVNVWYSHNGERLGSYSGHNGTVWSVDVDSTSTLLVTGSADNTLKLWRVRTGELIKSWEFPTAVKCVKWSEDDSKVLAVTEERMGYKGAVRVFDVNREDGPQPDEPVVKFQTPGPKVTVATWSYIDKYIVAGHEDGTVALYNPKTGEQEKAHTKAHEGIITDIQMSIDGTYFITSSKDKSAKLFDTESLDILKTYQSETPLNSAAIVPGRPYVLVGGGQEAMAVTTTSARQGHFEVRFWHRIFEEEVARVKGGFGPCNTIAVHPQCKGYAIGGEDGYVRVHHFDADFYKARPYGPEMEPQED